MRKVSVTFRPPRIRSLLAINTLTTCSIKMNKRFHLIVKAFLNICFQHLLKLSMAVTCMMIVLVQPLTAQEAEGGIEGMVRDAVTLLPLERVNIVVLNTTAGAVSDQYGKYILSGLHPGKYEIRVSMVGYETLQLPVKVISDRFTRIDLDLHYVSFLLDSVGITGSRPKRDLVADPHT